MRSAERLAWQHRVKLAVIAAANLALCSAVLVAAAPASATTLSAAGVRAPQAAVGPGGRTVFAWERLRSGSIAIEARSGRSPSTTGHIRRFSARGHDPRVAVGADGTMALMWKEDGADRGQVLRVSVSRPGHRFGKGQIVERRRGNLAPVGLAVQPGGRVIAVWRRGDSRLAFALAPRKEGFRAPHELAAIGPLTGGTIVLDPRDGAVVVAYGSPLTASPPANQQAAVRTLAVSSAAFTAPSLVSAGGPDYDPFAEAYPVAVTGPGGAAVAFIRAGGGRGLYLVRRATKTTWLEPQRIASAQYPAQDGDGVFPNGLTVALPQNGSAMAAWSVVASAPSGQVRSRQNVTSFAAALEPFGVERTLTAAGRDFRLPSVAAAGNEVFVALAAPHEPVVIAAGVAGTTLKPTLLATEGDGDVVLAAGGLHVLAVYQQNDRLRLHLLRGPRARAAEEVG